MTEERYRELVQALPDIIYSLDASGRFIFINDSVAALGWNPVELIGKHFSVLLDDEYAKKVSREHVLKDFRGKETGPDAAPKLFDERRTGPRRTRDLEVKLRRKDDLAVIDEVYGSIIAYGEVNAVGFTAFGDGPGEPGSVGIIRDITERKEALRLLDRSLQERDVLLAEIHHRVKNNLQVISSLLNLQSAGIEDTTALTRFADAQMQIQSMALVHEQLYRSDNYASVELERYIPSLCEHLYEAYAVPRDRIALDIAVDSVSVTMQQAVPTALLLNELISNSLKYAFPDDARGTVHVSLKRTDDGHLQLDVYDDGIGLPDDFDIASSSTLGHTLVTGLSSQLGGDMTMDGSSGTRFTLIFPLDEAP
jgi:PAS domain S-box-containing protein